MTGDDIQLVLCGEGATEFGRGPTPMQLDDETDEVDGFLQIAVKAALRQKFGEAPPFKTISRKKWKDVIIHRGGRRPGRPRRQCVAGAKLEAVVADARRKRADGVVFLVDAPHATEFRKLQTDLDSLRQECDDIAIAAGVAITMVEAALLADKQAVSKAFDGLEFSKSHSPEDVADPKTSCEREFLAYREGASGKTIKRVTWNEARRRIFEETSLATLRERCPKGPDRFVESLAAIVELF